MAAAPEQEPLVKVQEHLKWRMEATSQTITNVKGTLEELGKEVPRMSKRTGREAAADLERVKSSILLNRSRLVTLQQTEDILAAQLKILPAAPAAPSEEVPVEEQVSVGRAPDSGELRRRHVSRDAGHRCKN